MAWHAMVWYGMVLTLVLALVSSSLSDSMPWQEGDEGASMLPASVVELVSWDTGVRCQVK